MKLKIFSILLFVSCLFLIKDNLFAQTLRHMQYNLMYYTENGAGDCDETTNPLATKDQAFKCIVKHVLPDVLTVNELGKGTTYSQRILDNVLNTDGVDYYAFAAPVSNPNTGITIGNGLYYDTRKLVLHSTFYVTTTVSYFNAYKMYYRSNELAQGDTAFITFIVCHLKAGSDCETDRFNQAKQLMNRLVSIGHADNYVLCGDLNVYNASEEAYQHFVHHTNPIVRFYDPIEQEGEWDNNSSYADIFTQSTHTSSNGCFSAGGMDNRFDFILVSEFVKNGTQKVRCLPNTYKALGQDGNRYNHSLIDPTNSSAPTPVINALYAMSDHLPVIMDYQLDATLAVSDPALQLPVTVINPVNEQLTIIPSLSHDSRFTIEICAIDGRVLRSETLAVSAGSTRISLDFPFPAAVYLVKITDADGACLVKKIIKL